MELWPADNALLNCRYYNLDAYYRRQFEKEQKKGMKKVKETERTIFNDEEQRRYDLTVAENEIDLALLLFFK